MHLEQSHFIPLIQFRSNSVICYTEYVGERSSSRKENLRKHLKEIKETHKAYSGTITAGAKKRLTKAISLLVQTSKMRMVKNEVTGKHFPFKLSFLTLTIPYSENRLNGKESNKMLLEPFLRSLRSRHGLKSYVWKMELQKNGMIHYHLTTNLFINHTKLKNEWNKILDRNGLLDSYRARTGNRFPNSTDIKSVKKIKDIEAYLIKYVSKDSQNQEELKCKIWDCSLNLKKGDYFTTHLDNDYDRKLTKAVKEKKAIKFDGDRFVIYKFKSSVALELLRNDDYIAYLQHLKNIHDGKETQDPNSTLRGATTLRDARPSDKFRNEKLPDFKAGQNPRPGTRGYVKEVDKKRRLQDQPYLFDPSGYLSRNPDPKAGLNSSSWARDF